MRFAFEIADAAEFLAGVRCTGRPGTCGCQTGYAQFARNPSHPSLRFKKLAGYDQIWSVRINDQYRAIGERDGDTGAGVDRLP